MSKDVAISRKPRRLKLLQINRTDLIGERFNGYSVRHRLAERGVDSTHLVWDKLSEDEAVHRVVPLPGNRALNRTLSRMEQDASKHSVYQVQNIALGLQPEFLAADLVHYHIIHDGYFSIHNLPLLTRVKPSIWTWHDPWMMTGHCIYPMQCDRWKIGCGECPDLKKVFTMKTDNTRESFKQKKRVARRSRFDVILASRWMYDMARESPIAEGFRFHHVPFGVDLAHYAPGDVDAAKRALGVRDGHVVICLRAAGGPYKGLPDFVAALDKIRSRYPICVLTFQDTGVFNPFLGQHQVIELGWVKDGELMRQALTACDIFAMPSTAEAFGMMAIEAMACGKPVVVYEGTSLPEVTFAPECGVAVPMNDVDALAAALTRLVNSPYERRARGELGRRIAERRYSFEGYADRLVEVYRTVARSGAGGGRDTGFD